MSSIKPIDLHGAHGPNPQKVRLILSDLDLPHTLHEVSFADVKKPAFTALNPNGRMPAIHDPNNGLTLWESGAIIEYITDKYDTARKLSFEPFSDEAYLAKQWLYFQATGQGPYYGQAIWFTRFHSEKVPSAIDRYSKEIQRVTSVLEAHLKTQPKGADGPWLVGGKCSFADLAFIPWQSYARDFTDVSEFTEVKGWMERMQARPGVKKVLEEAAQA